MSVRYLITASLGRISFNVGPLCTGLLSALLSLARFSHNCILPLAFRTRKKLLHHSHVSYTSSGTIICCFCSGCTSSLRVLWSTYAILVGAWYGWLPFFTYNLEVPSQHPIPRKTLLNSSCIFVSIPDLSFCLLPYSCSI